MGLTVFDLLHRTYNYGDIEVHASSIPTPIGDMLALETRDGICLLEFTDRTGLDREVQKILQKIKGNLSNVDINFSHPLAKALKAYFRDASSSFSVPLVMVGTKFQVLIWNTLTTIPIGQTRTYSQMAGMIGKPQAIRAVGHANAQNPIAIVIPCHRLIGANGNLTGYGGGIWRKKWLLQHEQMAGKSDKD